MEFKTMRNKLMEHFAEMTKDVNYLFEVAADKDELWNLYLDSFPAGTNEIYRERRWHDCSCCRQFIKTIGNAVTIKNGMVETIWDFRTDDATYQPVLDALSAYVRTRPVIDIYVSKFQKIGTLQNFEQLENGEVKQWDHFFLELPNQFVDRTKRSEGEIKNEFRTAREVFKRSLEELTEDSVLTVLELIDSNTLYRGAEWKGALTEFLKYKQEYDKLTTGKEQHLYSWENSVKVGPSVSRIRNHSIGTLLVNISEGMDLDTAVRKYEQIVAPSNYKRPKEIYTKRMLEEAKQTVTDLGYLDSLPRRFATLDDITVNNILFSNKDAAKRITGGMDIFGEMEQEASGMNPKRFSKVEEVPIDKFVADILPTAREVEVYLENRHAGNLVSLIAPQNQDAKSMFKWENNFGWAYAGNMTDSMKERVKAAGGKVDGDLRFSIQWNDEDYNPNDFDAHCIEPGRYEIAYWNKRRFSPSKGMLDVDIMYPNCDVPAVENITYEDRKRMKEGTYQFFVHCYVNRGGRSGFKAEIEFDGQIHEFTYDKELRHREAVKVAEVTLKNGIFTIKELLPSNVSSREIWGVKTNQFVPVSVICYSPNYWDEQTGIGHKHVFFMLKDCVNPERPNGMFNEYLKENLLQHKRVFAALGSKLHVEDSEDQLSGVGFSTTKRDELVVKVKGATERVMKIKF